ncbi:thioesterase family protein [Oxalobacteraceae bacterium]|nr:thioesterase family protein [Oxalobacteraceae bacterium]
MNQSLPVHADALVYHHVVAYADTDAGGVVYHGRYLEMIERARNHAVASAGLSYGALLREHDTVLLIHRAQAAYHAPAFLEDRLQLHSRLTVCSPARSRWVTDVLREGSLLASFSVDVVAWSASTRGARICPAIVLERLAPYLAVPAGGAASASA